MFECQISGKHPLHIHAFGIKFFKNAAAPVVFAAENTDGDSCVPQINAGIDFRNGNEHIFCGCQRELFQIGGKFPFDKLVDSGQPVNFFRHLQCRFLVFDFVQFDFITLDEVGKVIQPDTALQTGFDFTHIIAEVTQTDNFTVVDQFTVAPYPCL